MLVPVTLRANSSVKYAKDPTRRPRTSTYTRALSSGLKLPPCLGTGVLNVSKALISRRGKAWCVQAGRVLEVVAVNLILLLAIYFVTADLATRSAYAAREGLSYFFTQSLLVETSSLQGHGATLQSPLTLAWLQLILAVLVIVDAVYVYDWVQRRRATPSAP